MSDSEDKGGAGGSLAALLSEFLQLEGEVPQGRLGRLGRMVGAGARFALASGLGQAQAVEALALARTFGQLKGLPMKIGQILSYVDEGLSPEARAVLGALRTQSPAMPFRTVEATLREDLGERAPALLAGLEHQPLASASIGQVHRGVLPDGTRVAVKVRHPGIDEAIRADFRNASLGRELARLMAPGASVAENLQEVEQRLLEECDYALEAERQRLFAQWYAADEAVVVPRVHSELCGRRVLVSDFIDGVSFEAFLASAPSQAARDALGEALYRFFVGTLYQRGVLAADPHPGNFLLLGEGRVAMLDYGCVRVFDEPIVRHLRGLSAAVRADDRAGLIQHLSALGVRIDERSRGTDVEAARRFARSFFGPALEPGRRPVQPDKSPGLREMTANKRTMLRLNIPPGRLLFLLRIRFGLHAVLSALGARCDWAALEDSLAKGEA